MTIFNAFDLGASGLTAQRERLNVISENLANEHTTRTPQGGPYRRKHVILAAQPLEDFASYLDGPQKAAVVGVREDREEPRLEFDPGHPDANTEGMVAYPNVNPVLEMVSLNLASRAFDANVSVIKAARAMLLKALEIGR